MRIYLQSAEISNVYVLGAGFDTLSLRIAHEFPNVRFIELDHPATQAVKIRALAQVLPRNLEFRACDLRTAILEKLFPTSQADSDPGNRLVIAEGLLMYFTATRVEELLRAAIKPGENSAPHNICIFSYMEQIDDLPAGFRPRSWLIEQLLALKREPFLWSASKEAMEAVVARAGGEVESLIAASDFDGEVSVHKTKGENLVVARTR